MVLKHVIECDHVHKQFGPTCALRGVSLLVPEGEVWALTGDNGSGKSTLMRLLAGVAEPTAGTVRVLGASPDPRSLETSRRVSYLAQSVSFSRSLTVRDIAVFAAHRKQLAPESAEAALQAMGIAAAADWYVGLLPHHALKRLALAIAFMGSPDVLLLDEPTEWLDPDGRALLVRHLRERPAGQTVLIATPFLGTLEEGVDLEVPMDDGHLGEPRRPRHRIATHK